jgi:hypothetical protein
MAGRKADRPAERGVRRAEAALELAQLRELLADRLDRLVVRPAIKPGLRLFDPPGSNANGRHRHNTGR